MWWKAIMAASRAARLLGAPLRRHLSGSPPSPPAVPRRFVALWGNGDHGRLGLGALGSRWRPALCPFFSDESDLPLYIACGGAHTLVLTEKGHVYATGLNNFGQLGITTDTGHALVPIKVSTFSKKITQISAGYHHSAAITEDGELYMWGKNSNGQLGLGRKAESIISAPTRVDCLVGACIKMVALGSEHSIALTDDGNILSWGAGHCGRLGHEPRSGILGFSGSSSEYSPRLIKNFEDVKVLPCRSKGSLLDYCIQPALMNEVLSSYLEKIQQINWDLERQRTHQSRPLFMSFLSQNKLHVVVTTPVL